MSTITLFCGPPGAGKTTLARRLEAEGCGVRLCTDEWQAELGVVDDGGDFHELLQARLYRLALDLLARGVDVILEDGLWMRAERTQKFADARAVGATIHWHVFDVSPDVLWQRISGRHGDADHRGPTLTRADLDRALSFFQPPTSAELDAVDRYWIHRG